MSIIVRGVQIAHGAGIGLCFLISFCFIYGTVVNCDPSSLNDGKRGALTVVQFPDDGTNEDDAVVSVEGEEPPAVVDDHASEFVPSDDWQDVKEGQKLPPGLHVQMDFKTGKKQAKKMLETKEAKIKRWDAGDKIGVIDTEKPRYTREQLKAALKDFKYQDVAPEEEESKQQVKENFRSYDELKKVLKDMKMAVKTEGEIVKELTNRLNQSAQDVVELRTILTDLEYYLHQIDNAQLFCDLGGMISVLKLMNSTKEEIREKASHALGAALQSNAKVQVAALESGVMQHLIRGLVTDSSKMVQKRMLYALSTLLRQFPFAQQKFLEDGGLTAVATMFQKADNRNIQIKIVTLLTDLLAESDLNIDFPLPDDSVQAERSNQYKNIKLRETMTSTGWCRLMPTLLQNSQEQTMEHDSVEKVVQAMSSLADACGAQFSATRPTLQALLQRYSELAREEGEDGSDGDDFFSSIHSSLQLLVGQIHRDDL